MVAPAQAGLPCRLVRHSPKGDGGSLWAKAGQTEIKPDPTKKRGGKLPLANGANGTRNQGYASACQSSPDFPRNSKLKTQNSKFNESLANMNEIAPKNTAKKLQKACNVRTQSSLPYAGLCPLQRFNSSTLQRPRMYTQNIVFRILSYILF